MSVIDYIEEKPKNVSIAQELYRKIREDILKGEIPRGTKLTETTLSENYGGSRTPVREALRQLEIDGLVEIAPNRGAFVVGVSEQEIEDLKLMRMETEVVGVRLAIERITEEELADLSELFEFMEFYTLKNDIPKMININSAFHEMIYNATHNKILASQLKNYQLYLRHLDPPNYYIPDFLRQVLSEHREIYNAFVSRDIESGAQAMRRHMENTNER